MVKKTESKEMEEEKPAKKAAVPKAEKQTPAKHEAKTEGKTEAQPAAAEPKKMQSKSKAPKSSAKMDQQAAMASGECTDRFCPVHGSSKLHGRVLEGTVISAKAYKTVTVDKLRSFYLTKYERYEKRHTKLLVHNPPCINAKLGDEVRIMETRPLSKTKHFIVIEVLTKK